jgi:hypothetical protein
MQAAHRVFQLHDRQWKWFPEVGSSLLDTPVLGAFSYSCSALHYMAGSLTSKTLLRWLGLLHHESLTCVGHECFGYVPYAASAVLQATTLCVCAHE